MYKFTNGFIAYDKETADNLIRTGYKLIKDNSKIEDIEEQIEEENVEDRNSNKFNSSKHTGSKKESRTIQE